MRATRGIGSRVIAFPCVGCFIQAQIEGPAEKTETRDQIVARSHPTYATLISPCALTSSSRHPQLAQIATSNSQWSRKCQIALNPCHH